MIKKTLLLAGLILAPAASQAGYGVYVNVDNKVTPSITDPSYPLVTAHVSGGADCWYDNGLADWNQFSAPGQKVSIYTERKNSGTCFFGIGVRWFALFSKANKTSPWVQVSQDIQINVNGNTSAVISPDAIGACGLTIATSRPTFNTDPGQVTYSVSGKLNENCGTQKSLSAEPLAGVSAIVDQTINIALKVGETKDISLTELDESSGWELGECIGNAVTTNGVVSRHTQKRVLPSMVPVTGAQSGQETCDVTAWHYPERSRVVTIRYVFTVK